MPTEYPVKRYPETGVCGLDCCLCPRYNAESASQCPGCCGAEFREKHPSCSLITCCVIKNGLDSCALCDEFIPCKRIERVMKSAARIDSFISYKNVSDNLSFIRKHGIEEHVRILRQKHEILEDLLANYNDGHAKGFFCISCQLLPLETLKKTVESVKREIAPGADIKEKASIMRKTLGATADAIGVELKLRK